MFSSDLILILKLCRTTKSLFVCVIGQGFGVLRNPKIFPLKLISIFKKSRIPPRNQNFFLTSKFCPRVSSKGPSIEENAYLRFEVRMQIRYALSQKVSYL